MNSEERALRLKELMAQLAVSVRHSEPDDPENWDIVLDQDTRKPVWYPRKLHNEWQNLRFGHGAFQEDEKRDTCSKNLIDFEVAQDILGYRLSKFTATIFKEENKPNPDPEVIAMVKKQFDSLQDELDNLRSTDIEKIKEILKSEK